MALDRLLFELPPEVSSMVYDWISTAWDGVWLEMHPTDRGPTIRLHHDVAASLVPDFRSSLTLAPLHLFRRLRGVLQPRFGRRVALCLYDGCLDIQTLRVAALVPYANHIPTITVKMGVGDLDPPVNTSLFSALQILVVVNEWSPLDFVATEPFCVLDWPCFDQSVLLGELLGHIPILDTDCRAAETSRVGYPPLGRLVRRYVIFQVFVANPNPNDEACIQVTVSPCLRVQCSLASDMAA